MSSVLETIAVILIIIAQLIIAYRAFNQIKKLKTFLPYGKASLSLEEYEIPSDKILELNPSDIVGKITYRTSSTSIDEQDDKEDSKPTRKVYSVIDGDITIDADGNRIIEDSSDNNIKDSSDNNIEDWSMFNNY